MKLFHFSGTRDRMFDAFVCAESRQDAKKALITSLQSYTPGQSIDPRLVADIVAMIEEDGYTINESNPNVAIWQQI